MQLGWAISIKPGAEMIVKERLVQPTNFEISKKATDFHHITQQEAVTEGLPLEDVLREFMLDMVDLYHRGGRVVIHHLEFDASIIARELERANLVELSPAWDEVAKAGLCTMSPHIGKWVRMCCGMELAPAWGGNILSLDSLLAILLHQKSKAVRRSPLF